MVLGLVLTSVLGILTGVAIGINGGHWVGTAATDAGGLPIFGWTPERRRPPRRALLRPPCPPAPAGAGLAGGEAAAGGDAAADLGRHGGVAALTLHTLVQALAGRPFLGFIG